MGCMLGLCILFKFFRILRGLWFDAFSLSFFIILDVVVLLKPQIVQLKQQIQPWEILLPLITVLVSIFN